MKKTLVLSLSIIIILAVGTALFRSASTRGAQIVRVAVAEMAPLQSTVNTNGKVEADQVYEVRAAVAGFCRITLHQGDRLKVGQPFGSIDDPSLLSELAASRAELESAQVDLRNMLRGPAPEELSQAEAEVNRYRLQLELARKSLETNEWLLGRNAVPRDEVEQSRGQVELLRQSLDAAMTRRDDIKRRYDDVDRKRATLRVEAAEARLKYLEGNRARSELRAPADGTLYHLAVKTGNYVNTGDLLGLLADLSQLRVRAYVDEPDLGRVSLGEQVVVRWDAHPQDLWKGKVKFIPTEVVAHGNRTVAETLCSIDGPAGSLIPNVNVDVEVFTTNGPKVLSLPRDTVFLDGNEFYVWLVRDGRAERRVIQTGRSTISRIEITGGLSDGDRVIIPGESSIVQGMRVQVSAS